MRRQIDKIATNNPFGFDVAPSSSSALRFGDFRLLRERRELWRNGEQVKLGGRAFDMLLTLVEKRGEPVSKRELMEAVWPRLFVEENNLQVQIVALRKALGPRAIVTIPGRGYQFSLEVTHEPAEEAPPTSPPRGATPTNLPPSIAPIYGREDDLRELVTMVRRCPIVSVVGPGGIGKTKLAEAAAFRMRGEFPDGVWRVDLAVLSDPHLVCETVARALGELSLGERDREETLARALAERRGLLLIDNCEHLVDAVTSLVGAIRRIAPTVSLLTTSQEPLKQREESLYRLGPLQVADSASMADALESGAVQLFVARVQALHPHFLLAENNVLEVLEICRRLDGIPLALELAAARVPLIGTNGVKARLDERFRLLTGGERLALRRHQTLAAAFEWSYGLLAEAEQALFELLGAFVGSFSLAAAQQMASELPDLDEWEAIEILAALVDKSLVLVVEGTEPRYRLLETTREFALRKLSVRGRTQAALRRHAQLFLKFFESLRTVAEVGASDVGAACSRLEEDVDNLRAALKWASSDQGDHRLGIELVGSVGAGPFWSFVELYSEPFRCGQLFEDRVDESIAPAIAARFFLTYGQSSAVGPADVAISSARRAAELFGSVGDRLGAFRARCNEATRHITSGHLNEARFALEQAADLLDSSWQVRWTCELGRATILYYIYANEPAEAKARIPAFLEQVGGGAHYEMKALLAEAELDLGRTAAAIEICKHAIAHAQDEGVKPNAMIFRVLGSALLDQGRLDEAEEAYRRAVPLLKRRFGTAAPVLDDMKLLLAKRTRIGDAVRVGAFADLDYSFAGRQRRPSSERNHQIFLEMRASAMPTSELAALEEEGRHLSEAEACNLAFRRTGS